MTWLPAECNNKGVSNDRCSDTAGSRRNEVRPDTAKLTNVIITGFRVIEM